MLSQFRIRYPQGSLISELIQIDHGKYIVRALVQIGGITLATGLSAGDTIEQAEDKARERALAAVDLNSPATSEHQIPKIKLETQISPPSEEMKLDIEKPQIPEIKVETQISPPSEEMKLDIEKPQIPEIKVVQEVADGKKKASGKKRNRPDISSPQETLLEIESQPLLEEVPVPSNQEEIPPLEEEIPPLETESVSQIAPTTTTELETSSLIVEESSPPLAVEESISQPIPEEISPQPSETPALSETVDFSDIIARTNVEIKRLAWTNEQGRNYLLETYGKRSRQLLSDEELIEFLHYLETQPTPLKN
jgi:hypothetical protein